MKNIIAKILITTCLSVSLANGMEEEHSSLPFTNILFTNQHTHLFKNFDCLQEDIVQQYRVASAQLARQEEEFLDSHLTEPMELLIPFATQGLAYIASLKEQYPDIIILENEIKNRIDSQTVTPLWYLSLGARIQAGISQVSEDELDIYGHVPGSGLSIIKGLTHKQAWKSYEKSTSLIEAYRNDIRVEEQLFTSTPLSREGKKVLTSLRQNLPAPFYWNAYGKGKLNIPFLIYSAIHDIFPLGMPKKGGNAHGVTFSPLSFTVHDFIHGEIHPRRQALKRFVRKEMNAQVEQGDVLLRSAPLILEQAARRYELLNTSLNHLFNCHLTNLALHHNEDTFKKMMVGFFWIIRERTEVASELYQTQDFSKALKLLAGNDYKEKTEEESKPSLDFSKALKLLAGNDYKEKIEEESKPSFSFPEDIDYQSWTTPYDFYPTSPFTGETNFTDEEIAMKAMEQLKKISCPSSHLEDYLSYNKLTGLPHFTITTTKRFIDIDITAKDSEKLHLSFPTLFHKWSNMDDNIALLKYGGIIIEKPTIKGKNEKEARTLTLNTLKRVEKAIKELVTHFVDSSVSLMSINWLEENKTKLLTYYQTRFSELEDDYQTKLKEVIASYSKVQE